ncbi:MAG: sulfotransferase [Phormidesmis sp.]
MHKSILILSNKSSGSSALQRLLAQAADLKCVEKTRHFQNESLYWTKAASVLGLPQVDMLDSEVPIPAEKAKADLTALLQENLPNYHSPDDNQTLIVDGWRQLCEQYQPIFLEKSPHHLLQSSALSLIVDCMEKLEGQIDFLLIGLVRNPMDVMYSAFRRWKTPPEKLQYEWLMAYENLRDLAMKLGDRNPNSPFNYQPNGRLVTIRYEDLASSLTPLAPVFAFCETSPHANAKSLNRNSLLKWQQDTFFGFMLAPEVLDLAQAYGYTAAELLNTPSPLWPPYRHSLRSVHHSMQWAKAAYLRLKPPA